MDPVELKSNDDLDRGIQAIDQELDKLFVRRVRLGFEKSQRKARRSYGHKPLTAFGLEIMSDG